MMIVRLGARGEGVVLSIEAGHSSGSVLCARV